MAKYLLAAAAVAVIAFSGAAFAEDGKATSTAPKAMSDSEMDKVTAGATITVHPHPTNNFQISSGRDGAVSICFNAGDCAVNRTRP